MLCFSDARRRGEEEAKGEKNKKGGEIRGRPLAAWARGERGRERREATDRRRRLRRRRLRSCVHVVSTVKEYGAVRGKGKEEEVVVEEEEKEEKEEKEEDSRRAIINPL